MSSKPDVAIHSSQQLLSAQRNLRSDETDTHTHAHFSTNCETAWLHSTEEAERRARLSVFSRLPQRGRAGAAPQSRPSRKYSLSSPGAVASQLSAAPPVLLSRRQAGGV